MGLERTGGRRRVVRRARSHEDGAVSPVDSVWDELGKIDYLLDQLAKAVERGEEEDPK